MTSKKQKPTLNGIIFLVCLVLFGLLLWFSTRAGRHTGRDLSGINYDFKKYAKIDPALMICKEVLSIPLDLAAPRGIAVTPGDGFAVCGDGKVVLYDMAGTEQARFDVSGEARCLAVAGNGTFYVGITNHVEVYDRTGIQKAVWDPPSKEALIATVAISGELVCISDIDTRTVTWYDRTGRRMYDQEGFVLFSSEYLDAAPAGDGRFWVANPGLREMRLYGADGEMITSWRRQNRTIEGFSGCCNPLHVAVRSNGSLVTSEKNIIRVKLLTPEGELIGVVAGPDDFTEETADLDLAVDSKDRILVLDTGRKAVRIFVEKK